MDDSVPTDAPPSRKKSSAALTLIPIAEIALCLVLLVLSSASRLGGGIWIFQLAVSCAVVACVWRASTRYGRVVRDLNRLTDLLPEIRAGREPMECLSGIRGPVALMAGLSQQLLRDVRQERVRIAELEDEVRQRIANRTVAMERTIGALRQQAARDGLTGLYNRRTLDAYLPEAMDRCRTSDKPLALFMVDVDYFKVLNDTLGHAAGDQMLRSIAQIIRSTIREADLAFRCGGDEFVIVLEGCDGKGGCDLAERIGSLGDALGRTFRVTPPPRLSIGVSNSAELAEPTPKSLLAAADAALYLVKTAHHAAHPAVRSRQTA